MWLISSWEKNYCCYKLSNFTKWPLFPLKISHTTILSENGCYIFCGCTRLVTTDILFSARDKLLDPTVNWRILDDMKTTLGSLERRRFCIFHGLNYGNDKIHWKVWELWEQSRYKGNDQKSPFNSKRTEQKRKWQKEEYRKFVQIQQTKLNILLTSESDFELGT